MIKTTTEQRRDIYEQAIRFLQDPDRDGFPTGLCIILANILITGDPKNQAGYLEAEWFGWGYNFKQQFPELKRFDYPGIGIWNNGDRIRMLKVAIEECDSISPRLTAPV